MKKLIAFSLILILGLFLVACGSDEASSSNGEKANNSSESEITVEHQLGETTVPLNPEKVVVFDFGTLDSMDKLGVEVTAVPQSNLPTYLEKYQDSKYENAGTLFEPDFEKLAEIDPDLIIISGRQSEVYEDLSELAPTLFLGVDTTRYLESFQENVTLLGQIFGKEDAVKEELMAIEAKSEELKQKAKALEKNGLIILTNDGNISAYGPGSRFGLIHDAFGFAPVDEKIEASTHGQNVGFEYIAEKNPDVLFVIDRNKVVGGEYSAEKTLENELVKKTNAYKDDNIVYLNPEYWYISGGGLISVDGMIEDISNLVE